MVKEVGKYLFIFFFLTMLFSCQMQNRDVYAAIPVIFDTDMESDVDDVGALAMLHALADSNEVEILGVMVCAENPWSILCADRINTYYDRGDIPLGQLKKPGVNRESLYARQVAEEFPGTLASSGDALDAVSQYRKLLASQPDKSVVVLTVGYLTNLRDLLASVPDQFSPLNGKDLVKQKVKSWVCMGGMFPSGREANIRWDTGASIEVVNQWPSEIIFAGWEIGNMDTAHGIPGLPEDSPVRRAYESFGRIPHKSWDQVATLYAVRGMENGQASGFWKLSAPGQMVIDAEDGSNTWTDDPSGGHRYLIQIIPDEKIASQVNALMMHVPE